MCAHALKPGPARNFPTPFRTASAPSPATSWRTRARSLRPCTACSLDILPLPEWPELSGRCDPATVCAEAGSASLRLKYIHSLREVQDQADRRRYGRSLHRSALEQGQGGRHPHRWLAAACTGCPCRADPAALGAGLNLCPAGPRLHSRLLSGHRAGFNEHSSDCATCPPDSPNRHRAIPRSRADLIYDPWMAVPVAARPRRRMMGTGRDVASSSRNRPETPGGQRV